MAPTPRVLFFILFSLLLWPTSAQLSRKLKQELLDLHNGARRDKPADNTRAMEWMTSLADQAQRVASQCTEAPPDQSQLAASLSDQYSWIGINKHFIPSTDSSLITTGHARESFQCWYAGSTDSTCRYSSSENREQLFYPDTHMLGCGAKYFSGSDRCHVLGVGIMVVCLYAPGSVSGFTSATGLSCSNCPTVAPHCVNGLCSASTSISMVPQDDDDDDDGDDNEPDPYITFMDYGYGSFAGGTRVVLYGGNFAKDQFNRDDPNIGNRVVFTDGTDNITCDVVTYYTTTNTIHCIMGPAPKRVGSDYLAIVTVNGKEIPRARTCPAGDQFCTFGYSINTTPYIQRVSPDAFVPGVEAGPVRMIGSIFTYRVTHNQVIGDDVYHTLRYVTLDRLLIGGEECNPWSEDENELYGGTITSITFGDITCKPVTNRIDSMNATITLSLYGNSQINIPDLTIDNKLRRYLFQTHPDISSVEPNRGSPKGGTLITIYGSHFDDPDGDVKAFVSGAPCQVVNYTSNYITCITGPAPPTSPVYPPDSCSCHQVIS